MRLTLIPAAILLMAAVSAALPMMAAEPPAERVNRTSSSGAWIQHGSWQHLTGDKYGFVLGVDVRVKWKDVEPEQDKFDFSAVKADFHNAIAAGFRINTLFDTGSYAPGYILSKGVQVKMSNGHSCAHYELESSSNETGVAGSCTWPDYMSSFYQERFLNAVSKFAEFIGSDAKLKKAIVSSQVMYGTTGDDGPYHGSPVDKSKAISRDEWEAFTLKLGPTICKDYTAAGVHPLWNSNSWEKFLELCPGSHLKVGQVSHGYQVTGEIDDHDGGSYCRKEGYHCRGETWAFSQDGGYKEAPLWSTHAHNMWMLTYGLDIPGFSENTLTDETLTPQYRLFNQYASSVRPPATNWAGGIIMLRDGLNSADKTRFPEAKYGKAEQGNGKRMEAIVKDFAHKGAAIGDLTAATGSPMTSRSPKKMNDVGWQIYAGNYGNGRLTQLAPDETSNGVWRVGPKDQMYGRFARQFNKAIGFTLDTRLWGGLPFGSSSKPVVLSVAYFDGGTEQQALGGTLTIAYDGQKGCTKASIPVGNSNRWKIWSKTIHDGKFGKGCSGTGTKADDADVMLQSSGGDVIISTIQVYDPNTKL